MTAEKALTTSAFVTGAGSLASFELPHTSLTFADQNPIFFNGAGAALLLTTFFLLLRAKAIKHHKDLMPDKKLPLHQGGIFQTRQHSGWSRKGPIQYL